MTPRQVLRHYAFVMPASRQPIILPDSYYLDNFNALIDFVAAHYQPLLTPEERNFYQNYCLLSAPAKRLYIRLLTRTKSVFRLTKLHYKEIADIESALVELADAEFVRLNPPLPLGDWLPLFSKNEILPWLSQSSRKLRRAELVEAFAKLPSAVEKLRSSETLIAECQQHNFVVYRLLFFGNLHQDMSAFVLNDLGLQRYEPYPINPENRPFSSRRQVELYLQYAHCREAFDDTCAAGVEALQALYDRVLENLQLCEATDTTLVRRFNKLTANIARQLEREKALLQAIAIYETLQIPPARERLARGWVKIGKQTQALELCRTIQQHPWDSQEQRFASQFGARLARTLKQPWPKLTPYKPEKITLTLQHREQPVELTVAEYYTPNNHCYYVENSLLCGVLGLAIWDIIFAPLPGAFYHPFQIAPADFYTANFTSTRADLLARRFAAFESGKLAKLVWNHFETKHGIANPLVNWSILSKDLLNLALTRIPLPHWLAIFHHLLQDLRNHRSGLPDLVIFPNHQQPGDFVTTDYLFIEVKGPGDRLQNNQLCWMETFKQIGIPHAVAYVQWQQETAIEPD